MPKLYSSSQIVKVLQKKGFIYISQKGSHVKFKKYRKEIPHGTFRSILRQAHLTEDDVKRRSE
ncbi:MAG: type II toxin-antitoxin system HicA family toxin [Parcubacteria group bacterium]|nr:type II toxin-antitoxin system HicA family toxin [Parcubacteria group bacterium]